VTFEAELEKSLRETIETYRDKLESGQLTPETYQRTCGTLFAFRAVIDLIPEIRKKINES